MTTDTQQFQSWRFSIFVRRNVLLVLSIGKFSLTPQINTNNCWQISVYIRYFAQDFICVYLVKPHTIQLSQHYYLHLVEIETVAQMFGDLLKATVLPRLEVISLKSGLCFLFSVRGYQVYSSPVLVENLLTKYKLHLFLFLRVWPWVCFKECYL